MIQAAFRGFILALLFLGLAAVLPAWGRREKKNDAEQNTAAQIPDKSVTGKNAIVQVTGRVRLVGNEPFPELVITGQNRDWYIEKSEEIKLRDLQQRTVTVEGIETVTALFWASGLPAGYRYSLKDIRIIQIE